MIAALKKTLEQNPCLRELLFIRGFLLSTEKIDLDGFPFYGNWNVKEISEGVFAYTHFKQNVYSRDVNGKVFFLFGHAYNPFTMEIDENIILDRIGESYGTENYQDRIDELTGIFVIGAIDDGKISFEVDPSGMQSACYGFIDNQLYITSHPQLIGDLCSLQMGELVKELVNYKWYYRVMGPYLPADMTQFDEVKRIVPNIEYIFNNGQFTHKRFYPVKDICQVKNNEEYQSVIEEAANILKNNMELVVKKWNKPYISLSGGIDSNTTFAAANGLYDKIGAFSFISAEKETIDADAARIISSRFNVDWDLYHIPDSSDELKNYSEIKAIIDHNNGYIAEGRDNEYRKRVYLIQNLKCDTEIKSWTSETIRAYWYKHYGRKSMPSLSPKLFRNLYKIFIFNRSLAHKIDKVFEQYIEDFEYSSIPKQYPAADMHFNEVTWGSWGGLNISEMKIYADLIIIYNNRKFLDLLFRVPLEKRISDEHHLDMKKYLNKDLYDMNIRVVNMKETKFRAFMLNVIFTVNSLLPF